MRELFFEDELQGFIRPEEASDASHSQWPSATLALLSLDDEPRGIDGPRCTNANGSPTRPWDPLNRGSWPDFKFLNFKGRCWCRRAASRLNRAVLMSAFVAHNGSRSKPSARSGHVTCSQRVRNCHDEILASASSRSYSQVVWRLRTREICNFSQCRCRSCGRKGRPKLSGYARLSLDDRDHSQEFTSEQATSSNQAVLGIT